MQKNQSSLFGLLLATAGCVALPATDLDGGVDGGLTVDTVISTGGTTGLGTGGTTSGTGGVQSNVGGSTSTATPCTGSFEPCGGDPTGTWDIVGVCVQGDLSATANVAYAGDSTACSSLCTSASLDAHGSVTYAAGNYEPNVILTISENLDVTASCYAALYGSAWSSASCASITQGLEAQSGTIATCTAGASSCECVYTTNTSATADTYTVSGTMLVGSDGSTTDFCVQGSSMTQCDALGDGTYALTQYSKR